MCTPHWNGGSEVKSPLFTWKNSAITKVNELFRIDTPSVRKYLSSSKWIKRDVSRLCNHHKCTFSYVLFQKGPIWNQTTPLHINSTTRAPKQMVLQLQRLGKCWRQVSPGGFTQQHPLWYPPRAPPKMWRPQFGHQDR